MNLPTFLQSSVDPTKLSLTVRGTLLMIIPAVVFFAPSFGLHFDSQELNDLVEQTERLVFWGASGISVAMTFWGAVRKIAKRAGWLE